MLTRQGLLDAEDKAWRELSARFERLAPDDWARPGATGDWTPKDVLAHVAAWHALAVDELQTLRAGAEPKRPWASVDEANADFHERCKDQSLHDVKVVSGAARHRFREEIAQAPEPLPKRIESLIAGNAHGHYAEHIPLLDAFLGAR